VVLFFVVLFFVAGFFVFFFAAIVFPPRDGPFDDGEQLGNGRVVRRLARSDLERQGTDPPVSRARSASTRRMGRAAGARGGAS
jgi:hypothetical protein